MTSKRDMLPRQNVEKKQGNFRAVVPVTAKKNLFHLSTQSEPVHSVYIPRAPTPPLVQVVHIFLSHTNCVYLPSYLSVFKT